MSKKKKASAKIAQELGPREKELANANKLLVRGNYFWARKYANAVLANGEVTAKEKQRACEIVLASGVDPWVMVAGVACLVFSICVAFLVRT